MLISKIFFTAIFMLPKKYASKAVLWRIYSEQAEGKISVDIHTLMALFHCMVRYGSAQLVTVRYGSVRVGLRFHCSLVPTAIEWAGLFTRRYSCTASTAVTSS